VAQQFAAQSHDDQVCRLGTVQSAPRRIRFNDSMQSAVTAAAHRNEVVIRFVTQSGIAAVVQIATSQCPIRPTDRAARIDTAANRPVSRPPFPKREPLRTGHVVAVFGSATHSAGRPDKTRARFTHGSTNFGPRSSEWRFR
jgi:hypothetical protein